MSMIDIEIVSKDRDFIENEAKSCSMDFGCIMSRYAYRMWSGAVSLKDIEREMTRISSVDEAPFRAQSN